LLGGVLTIRADVKYVATVYPTGKHAQIPSVGESEMKEGCLGAFGKLLASEEGADCTIAVGGKTFKAHRAILCARSPAFGPMFRPGSVFDEALKGRLAITDSTPEAVGAMLQYLYTGRVVWPESGVDALQEAVLKLADKYALLDLKSHVEGLLAGNIDEETFFHLVYLADDHSCEGLKRACAHYFAANRADIIKRAEWKKLRSARSELAAVLLEAAAS